MQPGGEAGFGCSYLTPRAAAVSRLSHHPNTACRASPSETSPAMLWVVGIEGHRQRSFVKTSINALHAAAKCTACVVRDHQAYVGIAEIEPVRIFGMNEHVQHAGDFESASADATVGKRLAISLVPACAAVRRPEDVHGTAPIEHVGIQGRHAQTHHRCAVEGDPTAIDNVRNTLPALPAVDRFVHSVIAPAEPSYVGDVRVCRMDNQPVVVECLLRGFFGLAESLYQSVQARLPTIASIGGLVHTALPRWSAGLGAYGQVNDVRLCATDGQPSGTTVWKSGDRWFPTHSAIAALIHTILTREIEVVAV